MTQPLLHSQTKQNITNYLAKPTHGLILASAEGSGKYHLALWLAKQLEAESYTIQSPDEKSSIAIEQIRELYDLTRTGNNFVVIIKDSQELGIEAQNAFLKLLEEPPKNTKFILTTTNTEALLPTIRSRSQVIEVSPPQLSQLKAYGQDYSKLTESEVTSLIYSSNKLIGTFARLLSDPERLLTHRDQVKQAKQFYTAASYKRHLLCIENKFEKTWASQLLGTLATIIQSLLKISSTDSTKLKQLSRQANLVQTTAQNILETNGNPKIHLALLCEEL